MTTSAQGTFDQTIIEAITVDESSRITDITDIASTYDNSLPTNTFSTKGKLFIRVLLGQDPAKRPTNLQIKVKKGI